ncbi:transglycosylase SLT domain-containing protein [Leptolyngbya sp. FACHB-261]|uniref:transglycosylase SLT domain-containing protein n=1 Tax=Leptolyngbya sp. FACHB-261 TaxID=2692806 RepID=UPI0016868058|nr:transglycosylase SLT domain-containing protein [Leptolyngbya sp. FACHB-261]MBD2102214.1 transglycosylase SLT domain-containing protein [Leptolyngbya sp. FACHB-261]
MVSSAVATPVQNLLLEYGRLSLSPDALEELLGFNLDRNCVAYWERILPTNQSDMGRGKERKGLSLGTYLFWSAIGMGVWVYFNTNVFPWSFLLPARVPPEVQSKLNQVAANVGTDPNNLAAVIHFETGGTWDPSIRNAAGSGATGLIQFMPQTAAELGTSVDDLAAMSAVEQLDYVEAYLRPYRGNLNSLEDTYMAVLYPAAIGKSNSTWLFWWGTTAYEQNQGLDRNQDGVITKGEAVQRLRDTVQ